MSGLKALFEDVYVLCLCEGGAEIAIMNMLLDEDLLIFNRDMLVKEQVHPRLPVRKIESKFLNKSYAKKVVIVRIIDSKNEQLKLKKVYRQKFDNEKILTKPEIEIIIIHDFNKYSEYCKVKSSKKPSEYCKSELNLHDVKDKDFMNRYFDGDVDKLLNALKTYKSKCSKDHKTIYDLVK
jgi:hypothetical protein